MNRKYPKPEPMSLSRYSDTYLKGIMSQKTFYREFLNVMDCPDFRQEFGTYRFRKLTEKQIAILNKKFLN